MIIKWYMEDRRFKPGTVSDMGDVRVTLRRTERKSRNKWRLYIQIRTHAAAGVREELKREIAVAEWPAELPLKEVQKRAGDWLLNFAGGIIQAM